MNYKIETVMNVIKKFMENVKSKGLKPSDITIYYDIDNTLALFSIHEREPEALAQMTEEGFYRNLPALDDGIKVIPVLQAMGFKVKLLSACIETTYCKAEKFDWIHEHTPTVKDKDVILMQAGQDKSTFVEDISTSILVDDYGINLTNWMNAGGIAIKKAYSKKPRNIPVINNHVEIFIHLRNWGLLNDSDFVFTEIDKEDVENDQAIVMVEMVS